MAGYKWILTKASIFVGHYLNEFYSKFENILMDSLSVIYMLKNKIFDRDCFYFYNVLQEFVHQHFSKSRNKNIIFQNIETLF